MNTKKIKFLCAAILSIHLIQSSLQATITTQSSITDDNTIYHPQITTATGIALGVYIGYNYLIRQEYLVANKFPIAQMWYDMLTQKYPAAHLDQKQFVQKPKLSLIPNFLANFQKSCGWSSNHDYIYFNDSDLQEITFLYQKMIDGYPLNKQEQLALARKEFILLHEAGHIEHDDAKDIMLTIAALFAVTHGGEFLNNQNKVATTTEEPKDWPLINIPVTKDYKVQALTIPSVVLTIQGATFMAGLLAMLRYQESRADKFACNIADDITLQGAITIFEDEEMDNLYDLENKKMTPFIKTNSTAGKVIQTVVGPFEFIASALVQQCGLLIKKFPEARWVYDFVTNPINQGPSVRAQLIKDELTRREHSKHN